MRTLLESSGCVAVVGEADDQRAALKLAHDSRPDVILLDTRIPGTDYSHWSQALAPVAPVLLLGYDESPAAVTRALLAGATGYLLHGHFGSHELVRAVVATARGEVSLSSVAIRALLDRLREASEEKDAASESHGPPRLSKREQEVVDLLSRGYTNYQIAQYLGISEKTVKNHLNHVYGKLGTRNRAQTVALYLEEHLSGNAS